MLAGPVPATRGGGRRPLKKEARLNRTERMYAIVETLRSAGARGRTTTWLAEHFDIEEGGKRYRFRLRDGVRFHDGRRLTARDVRFTFERLLQA